MKNWLHSLLLVSVLSVSLTGCEPPKAIPAPTEALSTETEAKEVVTIPFDTKQVTIPVDAIPALREYLAQYNAQQRQEEINRIVIQDFPSKSAGSFADIGYSCGTKLCSHVLVQLKDGNEIKTLPLREGSIFQEAYFSPDESKLAILFGRNEGTEFVRNVVVFVDTTNLVEMKIVDPSDSVRQLVSDDSFIWPIRDLQWLDNNTLALTVPDLTDSSYEALVNWNRENGPAKKLQVVLDKEKDWRLSLSNETAVPSKQPPEEYQTWRQLVESLLKDKPYILPAYDPELGPIAFVLDESSPNRLSFEMYRSETYKVGEHSFTPKTIHDFYYAFSWDENGKALSDPDLLNRFTGLGNTTQPNRIKVDETTSIIHDLINEHREDQLKVYQSFDVETQKQNEALQKAILGFLKEKEVASAQVIIINLERKTTLDFHLLVNNHFVKSHFSVEKHFSDRTAGELQRLLGDLSKLSAP
ncbi:hypothetical protein [uncultured Brevibacillus sp.]|uniref:hypothetical protein n=1 Tax=uncultured Brevibacillus sp. TaxID=169970 RepID=UPI002591DED5|nr:hypothetical protein [uncultured Brevibacillus sp.]